MISTKRRKGFLYPNYNNSFNYAENAIIAISVINLKIVFVKVNEQIYTLLNDRSG